MIFDIFKKREAKPIQKASFDEIKKRSRILIIDDNEFEYKLLFEKDGYLIDKWTTNEDIDQNKIDSIYYDIILLDVNGVATDRSEKHGLGLLEYIKKKNPAQIVILYSSERFNFDEQKYIKLADDSLSKSADYYDFKKQVDFFLENHTQIAFYLGVVRNIVSNTKDITTVEEAIEDAIRTGEKDTLRAKLEDINLAGDLIEKIIVVVTVASKFIGVS